MFSQKPLLLFLSLSLFACTQPTEDPKAVADKYWQYIQAGNIKEAEKLSTANNRNILQTHIDRTKKNTQINTDAAVTIVNTTITTTDATATNLDNNHSHTETFNTVLVLQQGKWKVDLNNTPIPPTPDKKEKNMQQLSKKLSQSMQKKHRLHG
ncbi:hypothetical protein MNBD_GAMMA06-49 [hydrothermal vent metagenome]|uniref:Uncharacterized protein n=1 Tax=hydrothermal vent metagenome TaxID=652676 RepID=A0A3B0WRU9_9ZZZZ